MLNSFSVRMTGAVRLTAKCSRIWVFFCFVLATPAEDENRKYCFILMVILNVF